MKLFKLWDDEGERWLVAAATEGEAVAFIVDDTPGSRTVTRVERVRPGRAVNLNSIDPELRGRCRAEDAGGPGIVAASCVY